MTAALRPFNKTDYYGLAGVQSEHPELADLDGCTLVLDGMTVQLIDRNSCLSRDFKTETEARAAAYGLVAAFNSGGKVGELATALGMVEILSGNSEEDSEDDEDVDDDEEDAPDAEDIADALTRAIEESDDDRLPEARVATFRERGVLTNNTGLVISVRGVEFQLTIVRSR